MFIFVGTVFYCYALAGPVMENEKPEPVRNFLAIDRYAGKNDTVENVPAAEEINRLPC